MKPYFVTSPLLRIDVIRLTRQASDSLSEKQEKLMQQLPPYSRVARLSMPLVLLITCIGFARMIQAEDLPKVATELSEQEQVFIERMSNTVLVGHFTLTDQPAGEMGKPERYEIREISKLNGKMWVFQTRVKYGKIDTILPIMLPIEWAGDTPVVSMTNFTIPGMGTFSCRVLFDNDRYAGTWQHGPKGGHMWGMIEKAENETQKVEGN